MRSYHPAKILKTQIFLLCTVEKIKIFRNFAGWKEQSLHLSLNYFTYFVYYSKIWKIWIHKLKKMYLQLASLSGPTVFGGLGKLRMTSLASWDLATITSLSLTAVCIRRTFEDSLRDKNWHDWGHRKGFTYIFILILKVS